MNLLKIINLTPDSFSGGTTFNSAEDVSNLIKELQTKGINHFDFGAESTAPKNDSINEEVEKERYDKLFIPLLSEGLFQADSVFSIDTYRPNIFKYIYSKIRDAFPTNMIIWNDVSGKCEPGDWEVLAELDTNTGYIFCHTFVPQKSETSNHMQYVNEQMKGPDLCKDVAERFVTFQFQWSMKQIKSKLIFDPCFGFSKNKEQNYELIKGLQGIFKSIDGEIPVVLGLSRKSFLRDIVKSQISKKNSEAEGNQGREFKQQVNDLSEILHWQLIQYLKQGLRRRPIYLRAHDHKAFLLSQELEQHLNS